MNLTTLIESAELQYKQILEGFFITIYDDKSLSSHGLEHHRRVWKYAREIIRLLAKKDLITDPDIIHKTLIACFLHDIGMSVDPGIKHGHYSMELCLDFLEKNHLEKSDYRDVLMAVENHDNKEYTTFTGKYDLLTILSVSDDLDAFGYIGIYRYSEIYLTRGIDLTEIGIMIIENAGKRFDNFTRTFGFSDELFQKHKKRYDILISFFNEYNRQLLSYKSGSHSPYGYCGVIGIIDNAVKNKTTLQSILMGPLRNSSDRIMIWFIEGLLSDL
jgi:HD superfamily phosphodiesterase